MALKDINNIPVYPGYLSTETAVVRVEIKELVSSKFRSMKPHLRSLEPV